MSFVHNYATNLFSMTRRFLTRTLAACLALGLLMLPPPLRRLSALCTTRALPTMAWCLAAVQLTRTTRSSRFLMVCRWVHPPLSLWEAFSTKAFGCQTVRPRSGLALKPTKTRSDHP